MNRVLSPKEDFRDWLVDNWFHIEDTLGFSILTYLQNNNFDKNDTVDRDNLAEFISERLKEGLLNVIETYEECDEEQNLRDRQLVNLKKAIVKDANKRKEKIIAVDAETFKDIYGKEIRLKFTTSVIEDMKRDIQEEVKNENGY